MLPEHDEHDEFRHADDDELRRHDDDVHDAGKNGEVSHDAHRKAGTTPAFLYPTRFVLSDRLDIGHNEKQNRFLGSEISIAVRYIRLKQDGVALAQCDRPPRS